MGLTCDYLILGAGAQGLAFADALLLEKPDCRVIIVDNRSNPGGQWNDTYAFAVLDQPSISYGVLSSRFEEAELNCTSKLAESASRDQILSYFNGVMECLTKHKNVQYFPNCTAHILGTGFGNTTVRLTPCFKSDKLAKGRDVSVLQKVVYSPYATIQASLPSWVHSFKIDSGVCIVRPHELTYNGVAQRPMYVVIGSGRTGIDTVLWLLSHQVPPQSVHWVMPRDSWFHSSEGMEPVFNYVIMHFKLAATAPSVEALFLAYEKANLFCRIDMQHFPEISPSLYLSKNDLTALRKVHNIIRLGHVQKITTERIKLDNGFSKICEGALCIDCTNQIKKCEKENVPVFSKCQITLQPVAEVWGGTGAQNVSLHAAFIGFLEGIYSGNEKVKNSLCTPINFPDHQNTFFKSLLMHMQNCHKIWNNKRMSTFFMGRPSRFNAITREEFRKVQADQAVIESSCENLSKILQINQDEHKEKYITTADGPLIEKKLGDFFNECGRDNNIIMTSFV